MQTLLWEILHVCTYTYVCVYTHRFQGKPFNITVTQVYAPTTNAEEAEQFYDDLQDFLGLTPKKCPFHHRGLECKSRKSRDTGHCLALEYKMKQSKG